MARRHAVPFGAARRHSVPFGAARRHSVPFVARAALRYRCGMAETAGAVAQKIEFPLTRTTHPVGDAERSAVLDAPGFGRTFTDHMAIATWTPDGGWHD